MDMTASIAQLIKQSKIKNGMCFVYIPHTTCAVTINENADPDVRSDIIKHLNKIVPQDGNYMHAEGNSAAHIKSSMLGFSASIPVWRNALTLGTWQGIYLCEFDGPRQRKIIINVIKDDK